MDKIKCKERSVMEATNRVRSMVISNMNRSFNDLSSNDNYISKNYDTRVYIDDQHMEYYPWLFGKLFIHNPVTGFVEKMILDKLISCVRSGSIDEFNDSTWFSKDNRRKLEGILSSKSFQLVGLDSSMPIITNIDKGIFNVDDPEFVFEMIEVYAMSLMRDVPFETFNTNIEVVSILKDLNKISKDFITCKLDIDNQISAKLLFRGMGVDEDYGPYISQFLVLPFHYGNIPLVQKYTYELDSEMSITDQGWLAIQEGRHTPTDSRREDLRYVFNGRILGSKVHNDPLYQFYYNAAQISLQKGIKPSGFKHGYTSEWTSGGPPSIFTNLAAVCEGALRVAWYNKYDINMRIRPEVYAQRLKLISESKDEFNVRVPGFMKIKSIINEDEGLNSILDRVTKRNGNRYLKLQYSEGSPTHPSYPAGHACVAGASCTVLKTMFTTHTQNVDGTFDRIKWKTLKCKVQYSLDGENLIEYEEKDIDDMTVVGEFNKLASNVSIGRNWSGVHYRSDGDRGIELGESFAISFLIDQACSYHETYTNTFKGWILEKFNGDIIRVTHRGVQLLN